MQTTPQRRHGRGSSGPESLFEVNGRSRKSKSRRSSKAKRRVKSPPDSRAVDSDWYVLCFNLAQFTLHSSRHVSECVNLLGSPDIFAICIPHVCYGDTERAACFFVVLLTYRLLRNQPAGFVFAFRLEHVQINLRADYFGACLKTEMTKFENKIKSRTSKIMALSEAVRGKRGVPHMAALICDGEAL